MKPNPVRYKLVTRERPFLDRLKLWFSSFPDASFSEYVACLPNDPDYADAAYEDLTSTVSDACTITVDPKWRPADFVSAPVPRVVKVRRKIKRKKH